VQQNYVDQSTPPAEQVEPEQGDEDEPEEPEVPEDGPTEEQAEEPEDEHTEEEDLPDVSEREKRRAYVLDDFPVAALKQRTELRASSSSVGPSPTELRVRTRSPPPRGSEEARDLAKLTDGNESLLDVWARNNVSGPGVEILQSKRQRQALLAFFAQDRRLPTPMAEAYAKATASPQMSANAKKEARGKTLNYEREDKEIREG
jgi:hypothetical protein